VVQETQPGNKGGEKKTTVSAIPAASPQEMLWETPTETWDSEARKQCFIVPAQTQWAHDRIPQELTEGTLMN
jgi:hypothetical protein